MIRAATEDDLGVILSFIRELAEFEKMSDEVVCTEDDLRQALFGAVPVARVTLATTGDGSVVGQALWYLTFSTFLGRSGIWLEDLYVRKEYRGQGYARELLASLRASTTGRVEWEVLNWNDGAISFYDQLGAQPESGWTKYRWV